MEFNDTEYVIKAIKTDSSYKLNKWEFDFIKSLEDQIKRAVKLTPKQRDVMMSLYRKINFRKP